jgi:glycerol uptake facilitator protein
MAAPPTTPQKLGAEFLGTAFLVFIGAGAAAATHFFMDGSALAKTPNPFSGAQLAAISFAFMFAVVGSVYAIGHISGGHINPAVTLSLAVRGHFPWREVPGYMAAQVAGAVAGAAAIYLTIGKAATVAAGGGVTSYGPSTNFGQGLLIEAIGTFILVFVVFGVIDHRAVPGWAPMAIGGIVFAIIMIVGAGTGAAINPARYLGAVFMFKAFGGKILWSQLPAYLIGEFGGGVLGGLAWAAIGRVRQDAALTSLAPDLDTDTAPEQLSGATS